MDRTRILRRELEFKFKGNRLMGDQEDGLARYWKTSREVKAGKKL
jgi:hypothetical protein